MSVGVGVWRRDLPNLAQIVSFWLKLYQPIRFNYRIAVFGCRLPDFGLRIPDSGFLIVDSQFRFVSSPFRRRFIVVTISFRRRTNFV